MKIIKILITGGGTMGHIQPALAVVKKIQEKAKIKNLTCKILYVGSKNKLEKEFIEKKGIPFIGIYSGKLRRYFDWQNFIDPFKVLIGFFQSIFIVLKFQPDVVFAKGGYVTFPIVLAAWILGKPIILHESDAVMGLTNRFLSRFSQKICVGFPIEYYSNIPKEKLIYTGNPVRREFISQISIINYEQQTNQRPTILITGGSQGAHAINEVVAEILPELLRDFTVIHLCGRGDFEKLNKLRHQLSEAKNHYQLFDFVENMAELMAKADLIISRAGANTLAEVSILRKPLIIIPLPHSANNHQNKNAGVFKKANAAIVIDQKDLTPKRLIEEIYHLFKDENLRQNLSKNIQKLAVLDSAQKIAEIILSFT